MRGIIVLPFEAGPVPYTAGCNPAPLTLTIYPKLDWRILASIAWLSFFGYSGYKSFVAGGRAIHWGNILSIIIYEMAALVGLLAMIRRERIEIYSNQMIWRKTYFGVTSSKAAPLADVLGAEWIEHNNSDGDGGKGPDYVEFTLPGGTVKACFGLSFDEFDRMREDIRSMYPELITRWGKLTVRSKHFTMLNLN